MDLFCEIPCLVERSNLLDGRDLCRKWFTRADKGDPGDALRKFIEYNHRQFKYLEVSASIIGTGQRSGISFRTSRYIGAVPLRAPDTGKQIGDLVIAPRSGNRERFEDYIEILDLLGQAISPETVGSLPLASGRNFRPPFYLEAVKFVVALEQLLRKPWRKFESVDVVRSEPAGTINWRSYVELENRAENRFRFPVRQNVLSEFHSEFRQMRSVFDICKMELRSTNVPNRIRNSFRSRLDFIEQRLYLHKPLATDSFVIKSSDRPAVKNCKEQANRILKRDRAATTAWRVDLSDVFEKFVLHIFDKIAHSIGGKLVVDAGVRSTASDSMNQEEQKPVSDAVLHAENLTAFIDAKYESYLFNRSETSETWEDELRRSLAFITGYPAESGVHIVCYPSNQVEIETTILIDPSRSSSNEVLIVGIPLKRTATSDAVGQISLEIDKLRAKHHNQN